MALIPFSSGQTIRSADVNANFTYAVGLGVPTGALMPYGGSAAPTGWLLCDGSAVNRTTYAALFAILSTSYGVGDGASTFNVPDLRGRVAVGKSTDTEFDVLGETGGAKTHTLITAEMPSHSHLQADSTATKADSGAALYVPSNTNHNVHSSQAVGGGGAHNNLQPYQVFNYIIKT